MMRQFKQFTWDRDNSDSATAGCNVYPEFQTYYQFFLKHQIWNTHFPRMADKQLTWAAISRQPLKEPLPRPQNRTARSHPPVTTRSLSREDWRLASVHLFRQCYTLDSIYRQQKLPISLPLPLPSDQVLLLLLRREILPVKNSRQWI